MSKAMLSCRGCGGAVGLGWLGAGRVFVFIGSLTVGVLDTAGASPKTVLDENSMQLDQSLDTRPRRSQSHTRTRGRIQHPAGHDDDDAGRHFDMNDLTDGSAFAVLAAHSAAVQRVPAIEDFDFLPDMGRMTLQ